MSSPLLGCAPAPADLVLALSRRIRCTEMDDLQLESVTTAGAAVVPALIGALAVGGAPTTAAATAGRLLGLPAAAIGHAIALALPGGPAVSDGGVVPRLGAVMELPWSPGRGLAKAHFKRWASAGQVAAAIDAAGVLAERHGFAAADVTAVGVHVPPAYRRMIDQPSGSGRLWSLISAQYQVAARLLAPEDLYDCVRARRRDSPGFTRLMGAVRVHGDESLAARSF